jgi:hypothetical protein
MSEGIEDDPSVNPVLVFQEGGIQDKGTGNFLVRFESLSDSTDTKDDDEPVLHSPIKVPRIAPLLITTRDTATRQTPAAATIVAARTETQNAASAAQGIAAATTTESPTAATAAQASTTEDETPEFIDPSTPLPRGSQKGSAQPSSTSKQKKKLRKDAQCRKGARVKVTCNTLYHVLQDDTQSLQNSMRTIATSLVPLLQVPESRATRYFLMICLWVTKKLWSGEET